MPNAPDLTLAREPVDASDLALARRGWSVGDVSLRSPFLLAPMSGVTHSAFRRLALRASGGHVGLLVTEFISLEGLSRRELRATARLVADHDEERPLSVQVFGADVDRIAEAARVVADSGAAIFDINAGCPAPKIVKKGGGAELMRRPDHLARLVEAAAEAVSLPVTVKMRSGWDDEHSNAAEVARRCVAAGAQMIAVHGRSRARLYRGEADWQVVRDVAAAVEVPVVGSGDIASPGAAIRRLKDSGCAAVMIGRAAILDPWIFGRIEAVASGRPERMPSSLERGEAARDYAALLLEDMTPRAALGRLKGFVARQLKVIGADRAERGRVLRAESVGDVLDRLDAAIERATARAGGASAGLLDSDGPARAVGS
jgi:nifR3 family TIM-barrel protein